MSQTAPWDARGMAKVLFEAPHVRHELLPELLVEGLDLLPWLGGVSVVVNSLFFAQLYRVGQVVMPLGCVD